MGDKQIKGNRNGTFSSSLGFVIACVGSAVGLGNIWMFPYRVGQYGGAALALTNTASRAGGERSSARL